MNEGKLNNKVHGSLARLRRRYGLTIDIVGRMLDVLVYLLSIATVVCLLLYAGFDSTELDRKFLLRMLHTAQGVFIFNILFNYGLRFKNALRNTFSSANLPR